METGNLLTKMLTFISALKFADICFSFWSILEQVGAGFGHTDSGIDAAPVGHRPESSGASQRRGPAPSAAGSERIFRRSSHFPHSTSLRQFRTGQLFLLVSFQPDPTQNLLILPQSLISVRKSRDNVARHRVPLVGPAVTWFPVSTSVNDLLRITLQTTLRARQLGTWMVT